MVLKIISERSLELLQWYNTILLYNIIEIITFIYYCNVIRIWMYVRMYLYCYMLTWNYNRKLKRQSVEKGKHTYTYKHIMSDAFIQYSCFLLPKRIINIHLSRICRTLKCHFLSLEKHNKQSLLNITRQNNSVHYIHTYIRIDISSLVYF